MKWEETLKTLVVLALFCLLLFIFWGDKKLAWLAAGFLALGLFENPAAALISRFWLSFSDTVGKISSSVILFAVFWLIVVPMGFFWRLFSGAASDFFPASSGKSFFRDIAGENSRAYFEKTW